MNAQSERIRETWRSANKLKIDLFNVMDEYPALLLGFEYPLKDKQLAIAHEVGPILGAGTTSREIERASGFKTNHTFLLYSKRTDYAIGVGVHFRQLNVQGQITTCALAVNDQFGGCSFFRLYDDPIKIQRWAGYLRLRRQVYLRRRIMFSGGVDLGVFRRSITNDEFKDNNLSISNRAFSQDLNNGSGLYFRAHAQLIYRL